MRNIYQRNIIYQVVSHEEYMPGGQVMRNISGHEEYIPGGQVLGQVIGLQAVSPLQCHLDKTNVIIVSHGFVQGLQVGGFSNSSC